jgi:hypothetical protein
MHTQTSARLAGALLLTATVCGAVGAVLLRPLSSPNATVPLPDHAHRSILGALLVLVMAVAIAMIPPTLFPVLRRYGEAPALAYVAARIIEVVLLLPGAIGPLMLVALSTAPPPSGASLDTVQALSATYDRWGHPSSVLFFCASVLLLNGLLFRSRLIPRWLAGWALLAVAPYLTAAFLILFGLIAPSSTVGAVLFAPLALSELVLAVWLVTKGFTVHRHPAQVRPEGSR